ncbi:MAG TPA: alpha-glucuronidase family glycosyl hydrolase [Vicinamibacterales bacterium]|nr:alpha-glucuronidase family glycosyl hydrolase [Vicinamibacterales bacterium]
MSRMWGLAGALVLTASVVGAEDGSAGWLRYGRVGGSVSGPIASLGDSIVIASANNELTRGLSSLVGGEFSTTPDVSKASIVLGSADAVRRRFPRVAVPALTNDGAFWLGTTTAGSRRVTIVAGHDDRGVLYGAFALLRHVALSDPVDALNERQEPAAPLRWTNEWDNLDGSIERGYAGPSIFFESGRVTTDLTRAGEYARLLASVGINGCAINNVNADARAVDAEFVPRLARIADAFRPWGVALAISIDFSSPMKIGGLDTFDPQDPRVAAFWKTRVDDIYRAIPDFGGFVLKADSEGRLGPSAYGRTHADAANVVARALAPHNGVLFYRGFVYDHLMDWRERKNDRARAAVDNFKNLDGQFDANVIVQIKNGPIDFQVREPASPLFAALPRTRQAIELQITQEYLGQQRHVVFLPPMWKETLDFDMRLRGSSTPVKSLVGGYVGVSNVGRTTNWLGHHLAMANLYGFGRLAWNPDLSSKQIADEWTRATFGLDTHVVETVDDILLQSWRAYEQYTGNLGIGTLTDIIGAHYGPGIESSERNGWGQWHRADGQGVGMDRTSATGTGFIAQYPPRVAAMFESLDTTPDDLLLFMHHVPYTHMLKSGETVIQRIYDDHYRGAQTAAHFVDSWQTLDGLIDRERYASVLAKLEYQAGHAVVWRDAVTNWFRWISGIPDARGRVGRAPNRVEAETMRLDRFAIAGITPWETASGGQAIRCPSGTCTAATTFNGATGAYDIVVQYFDENDGVSSFTVSVGARQIDRWQANDVFPSREPNGHTSTRRVIHNVQLNSGDVVKLEASPDKDELAVVDYVEIVPRP